jgi:endonuclease V-like protein UPF0215 family
MLRKIKKEIRIIGWDDAPFTFSDRSTTLLGVICRGGTQVDGVIASKVRVDGLDSTKNIVKSIKNSNHFKQLRIIMLDGITFGGFNIVDIRKLSEETNLPVIVVIKEMPDLESIKKGLSKFNDFRKRWELLERAGKIKSHEIRNKNLKGRRKVYYQNHGISDSRTEEVLDLTSVNSTIPEPVRIAHIFAHGLKDIKMI